MKKYMFSIILTLGLICNIEITKANDACTRSWGNAVNYITDRHMDAQFDCVIEMASSWLGIGSGLGGGINAAFAIYGSSCSQNAWDDFSASLDIAAAQYEAYIA